jgi:hypothetical protein
VPGVGSADQARWISSKGWTQRISGLSNRPWSAASSSRSTASARVLDKGMRPPFQRGTAPRPLGAFFT